MLKKRLYRELKGVAREPIPHVTHVRASASNVLEWHFVLEPPPSCPYAGGEYHGTLRFPGAYPHAPPSIMVHTPSGRFVPGMRVCLSMSDYHPETWSPMWGAATILTALLSFMLDEEPAAGTMNMSSSERTRLAAVSRAWNRKNPLFRKHFPDLVSEAHQGAEKVELVQVNAPPPIIEEKNPTEKAEKKNESELHHAVRMESGPLTWQCAVVTAVVLAALAVLVALV